LHDEKTAALFRASLELGAAVAGAPPEVVASLGRFGTLYGIAFQHADDRDDAEHADLRTGAGLRLPTLVAEACAAVASLGPPSPPMHRQAIARLVGFARALLP
jgi:geranylgeranyl pyrophosphate synthase